MNIWVKGLLAFEDRKALTKKVVHDGTNDAHFGFACGSQANGSSFQERVPEGSNDRRKVEGLTQSPIASFTEACFAAEGTARLILRWAESGIGRRLSSVLEVVRVGQFSKDDRGGPFAHARDGAQQFGVLFDLRILTERNADLGFQPPDGAVEVLDHGPDLAAHSLIFHARFEAVFLLLELSFTRQEQTGEVLESALRGGGWIPERRILFAAEEGDQERIDAVIFVPAQARLGVAFDAERIDHTDFMAALLEVKGHSLPEPAGGFQAGVHLAGAETAQPANQFLPAGQAVAEGAAMLLLIEQKHAIEFVFGDV